MDILYSGSFTCVSFSSKLSTGIVGLNGSLGVRGPSSDSIPRLREGPSS